MIFLNVALNGWKNDVAWYGVPILEGILEGIGALLLSSSLPGETDGGGCGNKFEKYLVLLVREGFKFEIQLDCSRV